MKNIFVGTIVCVAVLYAIDHQWFDGRYSSNLNRMIESIMHHAFAR